MQFIDLGAQQKRIRPQLDAAIARVFDHGKYIMGPEVKVLEAALSSFVGAKHCITCSSGTDALLMGLMAYGVGPGDAVFTTPFTFISTAEVISLLGATPVFVDIDPNTYNIDPEKLAEVLDGVKNEGTLAPKGIIPVDLFGLPADYGEILPFAEKHGLFVLQDAAQAFGAEYKGKRCPTHGHIGATSFFPAKPLGCYGDGGAVFTENDDLAEIMRSIRVHGKGVDKYNSVRIGLNGRMDTLQAAIVLEKLKIYEEEVDLRQNVAQRYRERLGGWKLQAIPNSCTSVYAQFCLESDRRAEVMHALKAEGIPSVIYYVKPLHLLDAFKDLDHTVGQYPCAEAASDNIFSLPMHPYLREDQQDAIMQIVNEL